MADRTFSDERTTVLDLRNIIEEFVAERDWQQFHSPKNLAMAMAIETAELMEHFQWLTIDQSRNIDGEKKSQVAEEMADVFCYLVALSNELDIDLAQSFERKMIKNRSKYPAEEYRGRFGADDPNPVAKSCVEANSEVSKDQVS